MKSDVHCKLEAVKCKKKIHLKENAFYLATKGGGEFFGKVGSFEKGYEFDAVIIDDSVLPHPQELNIRQRVERSVYLSADLLSINAKFVKGKKII